MEPEPEEGGAFGPAFGDVLMSRIAAGDGDADALASRLLDEFFSGYPVEKLNQLLRSDNERIVEAGAWIASELGQLAKPLIDELGRLLIHPSSSVRFDVLDSVLVAATEEDGPTIALAVQTLDDAERGVRWKAMNFLARASDAQLAASLAHMDKPSIAELTSWLLDCDQNTDATAVIARIQDSNRRVRLFAAAAAARIGPRNSSALLRAVESSDIEVRSFAADRVRELAVRHKRGPE